jgi:hypothetical protein
MAGHRGVGIDEPVHEHEIDAFCADQPAQPADIGPKIGGEA